MTRLAINYQNEKKFRDRGWVCLGCQGLPLPDDESDVSPGVQEPALETDEHLFICRGYSDLRSNKKLSLDEDLIQFFQQVCGRRASYDD